jgi:demethylmenaquinone methyltransferase/2-methoxy-6-polyprenyl-1,4-benzoquinol methylase
MEKNKNHWYDGFFYDFFIAPNQDKSYRLVKAIIKDNSRVLDAGCGTGRFSFSIADKVNKIDGVDLSIKNIKLAEKKLSRIKNENISFYHSSIEEFFKDGNRHYDYTLLSYVIHEIDVSLRNKVLNTLSEYSDNIIIVDYLAPRPSNYWSWINEAVEFAAGKEHYRNFKSYIKNGGIRSLAEESRLPIIKEIKNIPTTSHIAILKA